MKYILDNIIFSLQTVGGISIVWQNLINNLRVQPGEIKFIDYNSKDNLFRNELKIRPCDIVSYDSFHPIFSQFKHPNILSPVPFIFHSSYFRTCNNANAINVTTVHDFIYEQGQPTLKQKIRIWLNYKAILKSDAIVCVSENTKRDLLKYLPQVDPHKIRVIYNGVSNNYKVLDSSPYPQYYEYLLFVGGRQGYKNFDFLVKSIANTNWKLLICGKPISNKESELLNMYLPNRYSYITFPSNQELNNIYNSVAALVYPSSYEGFGIPVLEAQRAGCPVIALKSSSIPEIIGDTPLLMERLSKSELLHKLAYLEDEVVKKKIRESGLKNSKRFSWEKMGKEYLHLYQQLLENKQSANR